MTYTVMKEVRNPQFAIAVSKVREKPRRLPKGAVVGACMPALVAIMETEPKLLLPIGEKWASWEHDVNLGEDFEP